MKNLKTAFVMGLTCLNASIINAGGTLFQSPIGIPYSGEIALSSWSATNLGVIQPAQKLTVTFEQGKAREPFEYTAVFKYLEKEVGFSQFQPHPNKKDAYKLLIYINASEESETIQNDWCNTCLEWFLYCTFPGPDTKYYDDASDQINYDPAIKKYMLETFLPQMKTDYETYTLDTNNNLTFQATAVLENKNNRSYTRPQIVFSETNPLQSSPARSPQQNLFPLHEVTEELYWIDALPLLNSPGSPTNVYSNLSSPTKGSWTNLPSPTGSEESKKDQ